MGWNLIILLLSSLAIVFTCHLGPLVDTEQGLVRGKYSDDGDYSMFLGIPYARVNESNPFGASLPHERFHGVFNAYDDSAICPQIEEFNHTITGTLDCLHLNIYVPNGATRNNRVPVLVWIYGGGFQIGFAGRYLYGPSYLVRHDIILVTINYRVGPYGFMCLDTPEVPGNQGLKDQLLALRWIKNNIEGFGGDSDKITIFGESAGGMSADFHLYSEHELLYSQIITQSGTAYVPGAARESDSTAALRLARVLGLATEDTSEAIAYLSQQNTNRVIFASTILQLSNWPCVEKKFDGVESFITEYPVNSAIPKVKGIKVLSGFTNHETLAMHVNRPAAAFQQSTVMRDKLRSSFDFGDDLDRMVTLVRRFYIGDDEFSIDVKWQIIDFDSDITFNYPTHRTLKKYLDNEAGDVYYYVFSVTGGRNFVKQRANITVGGAAHADEIGYQFDISFMGEPTPEDQLAVDKFTTLWANFVKYGDPTPETSELLPVKWLPITKDRLNYMDINSELSVGARPFHDRMTFWDLFYKMNERYLIGKK